MKLARETFSFLSDLKENNNRDWFNQRKEVYLKVKESLETYADSIIKDFLPFEPSIAGLVGKKSVMRIYRDVRFSPDKSPYKINLGASFHNPNHKGNFPGYFLSIGPGSSFLAGGYWMPEPNALKSIRQEIDYHPHEIKEIVEADSFKKIFGTLDEENKLKTIPKDYPKDHPLIEILKLKSFTAATALKDEDLLTDKAFPKIVEALKALVPLVAFLREAGSGKS